MDITWLPSMLSTGESDGTTLRGRIGLASAPGRHTRDLDSDVEGLRAMSVGLLVSLVTDRDVERYGLRGRRGDLFATCAAVGVQVLRCPIEDYGIPQSLEEVRCVVEAIDARYGAFARIVVHCGAGLGRTGTIVSCWLVKRGLNAATAIAAVRTTRPGAVETLEQEAFVSAFERHLGQWARDRR